MRGFPLLSVVGAAPYALVLLLTDDVGPAENSAAGRTQPNSAADRTLRSWGSNLPALVVQQLSHDRPRLAELRPVGEDSFGVSEEKSAEVKADGAKQEHIEMAKVVLFARVHDGPSVESQITNFYPVGTLLHVNDYRQGWFKVIGPNTSKSGWIYREYLGPIDGSSQSEIAARERPMQMTTAS